ncbi:MAG: redoxin domain-containing protein [Chitinophagaceae bacterium]
MHLKKYIGILLLACCTGAAFSQDIKSVSITELEKIIAESKTPLVVNFWATFCKPCIEEIPYFQEEVKKHERDSITLLLVSLDMKEMYPGKIRDLAASRQFTAPLLWLSETNADYFCPKIDPKWSGAIPATLFVNNRTGYRKFFEEQLSRPMLQKEIMAILR